MPIASIPSFIQVENGAPQLGYETCRGPPRSSNAEASKVAYGILKPCVFIRRCKLDTYLVIRQDLVKRVAAIIEHVRPLLHRLRAGPVRKCQFRTVLADTRLSD